MDEIQPIIPNDRPYQDIKVSTKAAEGFYIGLKFGFVHAILYAPYASKEISLEFQTNRTLEYFKLIGRANILCCSLMSAIFGTRHLIYQQRDPILHNLQSNILFFRKNQLAGDIFINIIFATPIAIAVNFWQNRNIIRGSLSYILIFAAIFSITNAGKFKKNI